jgi:hypothetical protein
MARLMTEFQTGLSRSQMMTILNKNMDLNKCREQLRNVQANRSSGSAMAAQDDGCKTPQPCDVGRLSKQQGVFGAKKSPVQDLVPLFTASQAKTAAVPLFTASQAKTAAVPAHPPHCAPTHPSHLDAPAYHDERPVGQGSPPVGQGSPPGGSSAVSCSASDKTGGGEEGIDACVNRVLVMEGVAGCAKLQSPLRAKSRQLEGTWGQEQEEGGWGEGESGRKKLPNGFYLTDIRGNSLDAPGWGCSGVKCWVCGMETMTNVR